MNVDRGQESFSGEDINGLRLWLIEYRALNSYNWGKLAKLIGGVGESTLSAFAGGKYAGDNQAVAYKVNRFRLTEEERRQLELTAPIIPAFQWTKTAQEMSAQLRWAQRGKMTAIVGSPGIGKTAVTRQYAAANANVYRSTMSRGTKRPRAALIKILQGLGVTDQGNRSIMDLSDIICDRLADAKALLLLDEAQHMDDDALEQVRYIHDEIGVGVAFLGNAEVLTRIGVGKAGFAQLASRLSNPAIYTKPYPEDVELMCQAWEVTHPLEKAFLQKIAALPGCIRNMTETLEMATLVARSEEQERTLDHLTDAWGQHSRRPQASGGVR